MSPALITLLLVLTVGMLLRAPIAFAMLASGIAYLVVKGQDLGLAAEQILNGLYNSYVLLAVPLFIFAANLMNAGTIDVESGGDKKFHRTFRVRQSPLPRRKLPSHGRSHHRSTSTHFSRSRVGLRH